MRDAAILHARLVGINELSENIPPAKLFSLIERYYTSMSAIVKKNEGVIYNFDGNTILAGFGLPIKEERAGKSALCAALQMLESVFIFNNARKEAELPVLLTEIGLDFGTVSAGNISAGETLLFGTFGKPISNSAYLAKLSARYKEVLLLSDNLYKEVYADFPCRLVDKISVQKKNDAILENETLTLYTARPKLSPLENKAWRLHKDAVEFYYGRDFEKAHDLFEKILELDNKDEPASIFAARCNRYISSPPPVYWDGTEQD
jgi:adenylate cyclase